jgi:predicted dehydrogenase/threonine dehydrogenase-like Zn-dependent dehydrogenase
MKQLLQIRGGDKVVHDVPAPTCPPGSVLVRNAFSAVSSGTERSAAEDASVSLGRRALTRPDLVRQVAGQAVRQGVGPTRAAVRRRLDRGSAIGYSSAGRIIAVGTAVRGLAPGDVVACAGVGHANHAEVVAVPRNLCARVPDGVPLPAAALTTIAAVAMHGIRLADVRIGDRCAVIGCGLVGQITCRLLRAAGAEVFALDIDAGRAAAAGADHAFGAGQEAAPRVLAVADPGVDRVLVTAASASNGPLLLAGAIARDRANVVVVGDVPVDIPRSLMFGKELSVRVSRSYGPGRYDADFERHGIDYPIGYVRWTQQRNMECILELQARGLVDLAELVDSVVDVDDAPTAYERLSGPADARPRRAVVIAYPGDGPPAAASNGSREPSTRTTTRAAATPVAGEQVRVGLLGPGSFATSVIIPALAGAGARLEIVGGGSGPSAAQAAREFGFARVAAGEQALLDDPDVDAVFVCTRHGTHAALATRALRASKHIFCEKPLALREDELEQLLEVARRTPRILAVGFNRRFSPLAVRLRRFLGSGAGPISVTYRVSAGALPPSHWVHDLRDGGGRILGEVCHFVDTLAFLAGSPIVEVHAEGFSRIGAPSAAQDNVAVVLRHADGSVGTIVYVAGSAPGVGKERIEAFGSSGAGILDDYRLLELHTETTERVGGRRQQKGHDEEIAAFLDGLRSGTAPVPLDEIANVARATFGIVESLCTGAPTTIGTP